ncbi:MAG TPA: hypothetical protein VFI06_00075 [Chitinophagaceae bacterium]|nr:hypothetical protein [Chitinophagaceae bacterium]
MLYDLVIISSGLCHYRKQEAGDGREYASFDHIFHNVSFGVKKHLHKRQTNTWLHQLTNEADEMRGICRNDARTERGVSLLSALTISIIGRLG